MLPVAKFAKFRFIYNFNDTKVIWLTHNPQVWLPLYPREEDHGHLSFLAKRIMLTLSMSVYPQGLLCMHLRTYMHTHVRMLSLPIFTCTYMYVYVRTCVHMHVCMYVHMYAHIHMYMYIILLSALTGHLNRVS